MIAALFLALLPLQESAADGPRESMIDAALDATGETLVVTGRERTVASVDVATGEERARTTMPERSAWPWSAAPSPGGGIVAILTCDHRVWLWERGAKDGEARGPRHVATVPGEPTRPRGGGGALGSFLQWSSSGERFCVGVGAQEALLFDADGGEVARLGQLGGLWLRTPLAWSADGTRLAVARSDRVDVLGAEAGETDYAVTVSEPRSVALTPDGSRLFVGASLGWVHAYERRSEAPRWSTLVLDIVNSSHPGHWIGDVAVSPDGQHLAAATAATVNGVLLDIEDGAILWQGNEWFNQAGMPGTLAWSPNSEEWALGMDNAAMPTQHRRADGVRVPRPYEPGETFTLRRGFTPMFAAGGRVLFRTHEQIDGYEDSLDATADWTYRL